MDAKEAVRKAMDICGWSQSELAKKSGMKGQGNVNGILNRGSSLRVDVLLKMLHAMGFELIMRDGRGGAEYVIDTSMKIEPENESEKRGKFGRPIKSGGDAK